ncbi:MAG: hypothetical protein Q8P88_01780 [Candidatus Jorgensenbacteria bacterium]|nr:hypothetical protein [Candidatus Jorgensenbacteria bacterium]
MTKNRVALYALGNALVASCYIALIAAIMSGAEAFFGKVGSISAIAGILLLFASSAAILGVVVFGRSIAWYLEGKRADAVTLAIYTVSFLLIITLAVLLVLAAL